ncbi:hypothetical protein ACEPAG_3761 [Sanghuangporus baumii]
MSRVVSLSQEKGHIDRVHSIAFSPDGKHIASGSDDKTVCVWDAGSGERILEPFKGHTDWVWSVAFSPDGRRVASGSADNTICVWDSDSGELAAGPFTGHTDRVNSVSFPQMEDVSPLAQMIRRSVYGMLAAANSSLVHSRDILG